jgi:hypothetical protein
MVGTYRSIIQRPRFSGMRRNNGNWCTAERGVSCEVYSIACHILQEPMLREITRDQDSLSAIDSAGEGIGSQGMEGYGCSSH